MVDDCQCKILSVDNTILAGDKHLGKFLEATKGMTPEDRGKYLETDQVSIGRVQERLTVLLKMMNYTSAIAIYLLVLKRSVEKVTTNSAFVNIWHVAFHLAVMCEIVLQGFSDAHEESAQEGQTKVRKLHTVIYFYPPLTTCTIECRFVVLTVTVQFLNVCF